MLNIIFLNQTHVSSAAHTMESMFTIVLVKYFILISIIQ